jgi:hypothetical protein
MGTEYCKEGAQLSPAHLNLIVESAIVPDVARVRGYRTITTKAELRRYGFTPAQQITPTLLIPVFSVSGEFAGYQLRPDLPRVRNGKPVKYETPARMKIVVDVHPSLSRKRVKQEDPSGSRGELPPQIADPAVPLLITEGVRKADAAVSIGFCCVALLGVWNWRGVNETGGKTALPDWEVIALNNRFVYIAFDSDVMQKREVDAALNRLKGFLESRGACVKLVYLPAGDHGEKRGLDDFIARALAAGRSAEQVRAAFLALATDQLHKPPQGATDRPEIRIAPGNIPQMVDLAEDVLVRAAVGLRVFERGGEIVRVVALAQEKCGDGLRRPSGTVQLAPVTAIGLQEIFERLISWTKLQGEEVKLADCPPRVAQTYLDRVGIWRLPALMGVIQSPILRSDGSILSTPGYDERTGLFLHTEDDWPAVPEKPTKPDAEAALRELIGPFAEFPFVDEAARSVLLAAIMTALQRRLLESAPLFGFDAPGQRSGKSLLAESVGMIATGRRPPSTGVARSDEELRKAITSALREGPLMVNLDNITRPLGSPDLARAITQSEYSDRLLGVNRMLRARSNLLWTATGNNLSFTGDLPSRSLVCRIDAGVENPEERVFKIPDLPAHLLAHRKQLAIAALTVLRAYDMAGRPRQKVLAWGGFDQWSREIREPLVWLDLADPCKTRERIIVNDPGRDEALGLLTALHDAFHQRTLTAAEIIAEAGPALKQLLLLVAADRNNHDVIDSRRLGIWCRTNEDRVFGGLKLSRMGSLHRAVTWGVSSVSCVSCKAAVASETVDVAQAIGPPDRARVIDAGDQREINSPNSPYSPDTPEIEVVVE